MESLKLTQKTTPVKQEVELTFDEVKKLKELVSMEEGSYCSNGEWYICETPMSRTSKRIEKLESQMQVKADKSEFRWPKWEKWNWNNHPALVIFLVVFIAWVFIFGLNYCSVHFC